MKKNAFFTFVLLVFVVLAGCSDDEASVANVPQLSGNLQIDRDRIGAGQQIMISFQLPASLSGDVSSVEYYYELNNSGIVTPITPNSNNVCAATYTPTSVGSLVITFQAKYIFNMPDANGEVYRIDEISKTVNVEECDVRNSFWGDSVEETERNCGVSLTLNEGNIAAPVLLSSTFGGIIAVEGSSKTNVIYEFNKNKELTSVYELTSFQMESSVTSITRSYFLNYYIQIKRAYGEETGKRMWLNGNDADKYNAYLETYLSASDKQSAAAQEALSALDDFFKKDGGVACSFQKGNTKVGCTFYMLDGAFDINLTYSH